MDLFSSAHTVVLLLQLWVLWESARVADGIQSLDQLKDDTG